MGEACRDAAAAGRQLRQDEECGGGGRHAEKELVGGPITHDSAVSAKLYEDVPATPMMALNHISRLCVSVDASVRFYVKALGFVLIQRPPALDFSGAWYVRTICTYWLLRWPADLFERTTIHTCTSHEVDNHLLLLVIITGSSTTAWVSTSCSATARGGPPT
jgi:hypothetical protein